MSKKALTLLSIAVLASIYLYQNSGEQPQQKAESNSSSQELPAITELDKPTSTPQLQQQPVDIQVPAAKQEDKNDVVEQESIPEENPHSLEYLKTLEPSELLKTLAKLSQDDNSNISETLLQLLREYHIDPNQPLRGNGSNSTHYTAMFAALVLDENLTVEQLQEFLTLGSEVAETPTWADMVGDVRDFELAKTLIQSREFIPEAKMRMGKSAFISGNTETYRYIAENVDGFLEKNHEYIQEITNESFNNRYRYFNNKEKTRFPVGSKEYIAHHHWKFSSLADQIQFALTSNQLSTEQRLELQAKLQEVNKTLGELVTTE